MQRTRLLLIHTVRRTFGNRTFRRLADNAASLFALQGLTYLISFLTFPYLLRTLGAAHFGSVAFANAVVAQMILLTDFGFGSSATRLVAMHAGEKDRLNAILGAVTGVKLLLMLGAGLVLLLLMFGVPKFHGVRFLLAIAFLQVLGSVFSPNWLLQGLERMRFIAIASVLARLSSAMLIFVLVRGPGDAAVAVACQSFGAILQGAVAFGFVLSVLRLRGTLPTRADLWAQAKDSFHPFLGASMGNLIGGSSVLFLGFFKDLATVGSYAAVERAARAEVFVMLPASQAAYPYIAQQFQQSLAAGNRAMRKLCTWLLSGALVLVGAIALFAKPLLHLLYGNSMAGQVHLFASFSVWAFFSLVNTLLGLHYLIASGHPKAYGRSIFWSALLTVALFLVLIRPLAGWGALGAVVAGELLQTALMLLAIRKINVISKVSHAPEVEAL